MSHFHQRYLFPYFTRLVVLYSGANFQFHQNLYAVCIFTLFLVEIVDQAKILSNLRKESTFSGLALFFSQLTEAACACVLQAIYITS